jgi:hypothetical protein
MQFRTILGTGAIALISAYPAAAQPVPAIARNACIQRTAEEMTVATRDISVVSASSVDAENGVRTLFMRNNRTRQTAECRVNTIDGTVLSVNLTGGNNTTPPVNSTPTEGNFDGRGTASGSVFGRGRQANASLSFNRGNFSVGIFAPGTSNEVQYQGTINQLRSQGINGFTLDARIRSFASSANNRRVVNTSGSCRIQVSDARITSISCNANVRGGNTQFTGMAQF